MDQNPHHTTVSRVSLSFFFVQVGGRHRYLSPLLSREGEYISPLPPARCEGETQTCPPRVGDTDISLLCLAGEVR